MADASTRGRRNRGKGSRWELDVARYLTRQLDIGEVVSTRSLSGGTRLGNDLATVHRRDDKNRPIAVSMDVAGWSLECKDDETTPVVAMLRQARADADGSDLYAVIHKRRRCAVGTANVYLPLAALIWWISATTLPADHPGRDLTVTIDLEGFAALLELDAAHRDAA